MKPTGDIILPNLKIFYETTVTKQYGICIKTDIQAHFEDIVNSVLDHHNKVSHNILLVEGLPFNL